MIRMKRIMNLILRLFLFTAIFSHLKMLIIQPGGDPGSKLWLKAGLKTRLQPGLDLEQITVSVPVLMPKLGFNPCERGARNLFAHLYKYESSHSKWVCSVGV